MSDNTEDTSMIKEELQTALAETIKSLNETLSGATDFAIEQMPEVVQQMLLWNMVSSLLSFAFFTAIFVGCLIYSKKPMYTDPTNLSEKDAARFEQLTKLKTYTISYEQKEELKSLTHKMLKVDVLCARVSAVLALLLTLCCLTWLKILLTPKWYLLEYVAGLVK